MKSLLKWLYPGLGIKRWFLLFLGGVGMGSYGLAMLLPLPLPPLSPLRGILFICLGTGMAVVGLRQTFRSLLSVLLPQDEERLADVVYRRRHLGKGPKIVALGGGTGLSVLLRGLKEYTGNITAIVTVTDTGGSSGRLREELGILPPGDIRNCLVALADTEPLMESLFQHRFQSGEGLAGHNLGNLFLAGLTEILGDFSAAVRQASRVLAVQGQVLPSTLENVTLQAELATGERVVGETNIAGQGERIRRLSLVPAKPRPVPEAVEAIREADAIVLGPGSLYTSVLPNLLVEELAEAIRLSPAPCIYVCNVMTQWGETHGYTAADHLEVLQEHIGAGLVDYIIVNTVAAPPRILERYRQEKAHPVRVDLERLQKMGVRIIRGNFISYTNYVRHDPARLARAVMKLVVGSYFRQPFSGRW
ncbi:MAG: YvcK family protein [bacterium]|jgi:uncharacterized cofD-like protein|nr:YvcK family protein [Bacillota bacterium]